MKNESLPLLCFGDSENQFRVVDRPEPRNMAGLFRPRGVLSSDTKYASAARILKIPEMLEYRDTWKEPPTPDFDFEAIMSVARTPVETKPPEKLEMSENGFRVANQEELDKSDRVVRLMQSTLNRLTEQNYSTLVPACLIADALEADVIDLWVARIFAKALDEPLFCHLYAKMALDLAKFELDTTGKKAVRTSIVRRAQEVYEADRSAVEAVRAAEIAASASQNGKKTKGGTSPPPPPSEEEVSAADKLRKKKLANIKLIGELYKCGLLADRIITSIVSGVILDKTERPPEVDIEMVIQLLMEVGKLLEKKGNINVVYTTVEQLTQVKPPFSKRVTFQMMNLLDLRKAGWATKRTETSSPPAQQIPPSQAAAVGSGKMGSSPVDPSTPLSPTKKGLPNPNHTFAPLPPQLSVAAEKAVEKEMKAAALNQLNVQTAVQGAVKTLRSGEHQIRDALIVSTAATQACSITDGIVAEAIFNTFLMKSVWEGSEVTNGLAWTIATGIIDGIAEDVPKFFPRFAAYLIKTGWQMDRLAKEVFGKAAWCLDSAYGTHDGTPEWVEMFCKVWELTVDELKNLDEKAPQSSLESILDGLCSAKGTNFLRQSYADILETLVAKKLCTPETLNAWRQARSTSTNAAVLCGEIDLLYPL